jgi:hypothetical protein
MVDFAALPNQLDDFHDWVIWLAAVLAALSVIVVTIQRFRKAFGRTVRGYMTDVLRGELDCLNTKIDKQAEALNELTALNSEQHAETAAKISDAVDKIGDLQLQLAQHILSNPGLPASITGPLPIIPGRHRQGQ